MLSQICFQQIRDNFWYGLYGEFQVVIDASDGYVNASKMCRAGGKKFKEWKRLKGSQHLITVFERSWVPENTPVNFQNGESTLEDLEAQMCAPRFPACKFVQPANLINEDRLISGTYVHPDLIPSIAGWISPEFQLKANRVVNRYIVNEWKTKLEASERAATELLSSLQTTQLALDSSIECNALLQGNINDWQAVSNLQNNIIDIKKEVVETLQDTIGEKVRERQMWAQTHSFTMLKTNEENPKHGFYVIRCQGKRVGAAIRKLRQKHQRAEVIYQQKRVPNAVNLYTRLKNHRVVEHKHNYCTPTCSPQQLIYHLNSLCGTNYPSSNPAPFNSGLSE
jgi:KilA-N domain/Protein of unknown function (DUF3627)